MKWRSLEESAQEKQTRSLGEVYAERKNLIAKYVPAEIQDIHARVVEELKHSALADRALKPGDPAPEFALKDQNGNLVRSADLLERGPLIVCFFRGRWCPFCVGQMEAMDAIVSPLRDLGASIVAVSPQAVHQSYLMADQHKLRFPVLSDAENQVARQFGVVYRVPEYQQEVYLRAFTNLPFVNGDPSWELPIPATYVLAGNHGGPSDENTQKNPSQIKTIVRRAWVNPDYTSRPEPLELLNLFHRF